MNIELNNLIEWIAGVERWMNNPIEWIFEIRYWIEYWIGSFLGPIQRLIESSKSIEHPYIPPFHIVHLKTSSKPPASPLHCQSRYIGFVSADFIFLHPFHIEHLNTSSKVSVLICLPVSDGTVAITYLGNEKEKEGEVITYQKEKEVITFQKEEDEVISYQNNNMENEDTKYVVSKLI